MLPERFCGGGWLVWTLVNCCTPIVPWHRAAPDQWGVLRDNFHLSPRHILSKIQFLRYKFFQIQFPQGTSSHGNGTTNSLCCCYCAHSGHSARLLWRGFVSRSICLFCPPTICLQDWPGRGNLKLDTFLTIVMIIKAEWGCIRRIYLLCWKGTLFLLSSFSSTSISLKSKDIRRVENDDTSLMRFNSPCANSNEYNPKIKNILDLNLANKL